MKVSIGLEQVKSLFKKACTLGSMLHTSHNSDNLLLCSEIILLLEEIPRKVTPYFLIE
jgi:hypothetical protein